MKHAILTFALCLAVGCVTKTEFQPYQSSVRDLQVETDELEKRLPELAGNPCLIAWGGKDFVFDRHFLKQWKRIFPQASVLEYPDCGHYIFEDGGPSLVKAISDFMDKNETGNAQG